MTEQSNLPNRHREKVVQRSPEVLGQTSVKEKPESASAAQLALEIKAGLDATARSSDGKPVEDTIVNQIASRVPSSSGTIDDSKRQGDVVNGGVSQGESEVVVDDDNDEPAKHIDIKETLPTGESVIDAQLRTVDGAEKDNNVSERFHTPDPTFIAELIAVGAIQPAGEDMPSYMKSLFPVDLDNRVIEAKVRARTPRSEKPPGSRLERETAQQLYKEVVKDLVESGLLDKNLAVLIGRNLRPANVSISGERTGLSYRLYDGEVNDPFSGGDSGQPEEHMGFDKPETIALRDDGRYEALLRDFLGREGVMLSEEAVADVVRKGILAHEIGHAAHNALARRQARDRLSESNLDPRETVEASYQNLEMQVYDSFPLPEEVRNLFEGARENNFFNRASTSRERIARGFELAEVDLALVAQNVDSAKGRAVVAALEKHMQQDIDDFRNLSELCETNGMNLPDVLLAMHRLNVATEPDTTQPSTYYSSIDVGYGAGLTREQIKAWIDMNKQSLRTSDPIQKKRSESVSMVSEKK